MDKYSRFNCGLGLLTDCMKRAIDEANRSGKTQLFDMNGIDVAVGPNADFDTEMAWYNKAQEVQGAYSAYARQEYEKTEGFKVAQEAEFRKASELAKEIEAAKKFPFEIAEGMEIEYADYVKLNSTIGYSRSVVVYGEVWAQLMQKEMAAGKTLEACADETSHKADIEGITGFMYGAAVNALSKFWKHGEALRVWHNKQYNHEGAGVVNPAIITIKTE